MDLRAAGAADSRAAAAAPPSDRRPRPCPRSHPAPAPASRPQHLNSASAQQQRGLAPSPLAAAIEKQRRPGGHAAAVWESRAREAWRRGPARSLLLSQRRRPSAGAEARRARCGFLCAGDRAPAQRPGAIAAAFSAPAPARRPGALAAAVSAPATKRRRGGPAPELRLSLRRRLSAGAEARRDRCSFLGAGMLQLSRRAAEKRPEKRPRSTKDHCSTGN